VKVPSIIRPHHSTGTMYVDVQLSVTDQVAWSVGLSVTLVSSANMAEPIEMPFGLRTRVVLGTMY